MNAGDVNGMTVSNMISSVFKALVCILKNSDILTKLKHKSLWIASFIIAKPEDILKRNEIKIFHVFLSVISSNY